MKFFHKEKPILKIFNNITFLSKKLVSFGFNPKISVTEEKISIMIDISKYDFTKEKAKLLENIVIEEIGKKFLHKISVFITSDKKLKSEKDQIEKIPGVKKIIAVSSAKGGVGKSTAAVNLAISMHRIGLKTAIVDADIYGPSISHLMNLNQKPEFKGGKIIPLENYDIKVISMGVLFEKDSAAIWRGAMITKALNQMINGTSWQDIDIMIIDLPPGTGDVHLTMMQKFPIDAVVLISTPSKIAVIDLVKSIDMYEKLNIKIAGIIENMSYLMLENGHKQYIFGRNEIEKLAIEHGIEFLGKIPIEEEINQANDQGEPICHSKKSSNIAREFGKIAENILSKIK